MGESDGAALNAAIRRHTGFGDCDCDECYPPQPEFPLADHDATASTFDFPKGWRRVRNNWAQTWTLGPINFEIEWVPKARQFGFWLNFDFSGGRYDD